MARDFDAASFEYLKASSAVVSAPPFTLACWVNTGNTAQYRCALSLADKDAILYHALIIDHHGGVIARTYDGAVADSITPPPTFTFDAWQHVTGVWAATDSRTAYLSGTPAVANADNRAVPNVDCFSISYTADATPVYPFDGLIAHAAAWSAALTGAEVALLAAKVSPLIVRPQSLVAYWPLFEASDADIVGGYHMTAYNTPSWAESVPITMPSGIIVPGVSAGVLRAFPPIWRGRGVVGSSVVQGVPA